MLEESSFVMCENTSVKTILYGNVRYNGLVLQNIIIFYLYTNDFNNNSGIGSGGILINFFSNVAL